MPIPKKTPAARKSTKPAATLPARSSKPAHSASMPAVKRPLTPALPVTKPAASAAVHVILDKPAKAKKPKLVRDSFTIPKLEYVVLDELKQRAWQLNSQAKKSELLRAGIKALAAMSDAALLAALQAVPAIKTGRPTKA
jgi:hypothetical protein